MAKKIRTVYKTRPKKAKEFIKAFPDFLFSITETCMFVGVSRQTYYNWVDYVDNFEKDLKVAEEELKDKIENVLLKKALDGHIKALEIVVNAKLADRNYRKEKTEVEVNINPFLDLIQQGSVKKSS